MSQSKEYKALIDLNNAWNELAPGADIGFVWRLVKDMKADGTVDLREQCKAVTGRLWDGLAYGNWPSALK